MTPKPNEHGQINFRGFKQVYMVSVLEGEGTKDSPYHIVNYIYDDGKDTYLGCVVRDSFTADYLNS